MEVLQKLFTEFNNNLPIFINFMLMLITYWIYSVSSRSEVVTYLRLDRYLVFICVENIGKGAARNIHFKFPKSFKIHGDRKLKDVNFFDKGIAFLPPGQKKEIFVASYAGGNKEVLEQKPIEIEISYKGRIRKKKATYNIDFDEFQGIMLVGEPPLDKIAKSIEAIQRDLKQITKK